MYSRSDGVVTTWSERHLPGFHSGGGFGGLGSTYTELAIGPSGGFPRSRRSCTWAGCSGKGAQRHGTSTVKSPQ